MTTKVFGNKIYYCMGSVNPVAARSVALQLASKGVRSRITQDNLLWVDNPRIKISLSKNPILPEIGLGNPGLQLPKLKTLPASVKLEEEYRGLWYMTWKNASGKSSSIGFHADTRKDAERKARLYYRRAIALGLTNPILPEIGSRRNVTMTGTRTEVKLISPSMPINVRKPTKEQLRRWNKIPSLFSDVTEKDREEAWKRGCVI